MEGLPPVMHWPLCPLWMTVTLPGEEGKYRNIIHDAGVMTSAGLAHCSTRE